MVALGGFLEMDGKGDARGLGLWSPRRGVAR